MNTTTIEHRFETMLEARHRADEHPTEEADEAYAAAMNGCLRLPSRLSRDGVLLTIECDVRERDAWRAWLAGEDPPEEDEEGPCPSCGILPRYSRDGDGESGPRPGGNLYYECDCYEQSDAVCAECDAVFVSGTGHATVCLCWRCARMARPAGRPACGHVGYPGNDPENGPARACELQAGHRGPHKGAEDIAAERGEASGDTWHWEAEREAARIASQAAELVPVNPALHARVVGRPPGVPLSSEILEATADVLADENSPIASVRLARFVASLVKVQRCTQCGRNIIADDRSAELCADCQGAQA